MGKLQIRKAQTITQTSLNNTVYSDFLSNMDIHPNKLDVVLHYNPTEADESKCLGYPKLGMIKQKSLVQFGEEK